MADERFTLRAAVYGLLIKDDRLLMLRRFNTGWQDGNYGLPAGHLEAGESITEALRREVREETGIELRPGQERFVHVMHRTSNGRSYMDFFFVISEWEGEPQNTEPEKCDDLSWFSLNTLPENTVPSVRFAIEKYKSNIALAEFGWHPGEIE
ncbi:MAG: NUDIX domain-containing protein [Candidatus Pacebacteria bacterium]|nr:NUDIX domain-containing protein [Candidatus Paceibacterota bacterium]